MTIKYAAHCLLLGDSTPTLPGQLVAVTGGYVVQQPDQRVVSVQPDGSLDTRAPGTEGLWEVCQIDSGLNVLRYSINGVPYVLPYAGQ